MRASHHTRSMLTWWIRGSTVLADLAIRRSDGTMIFHDELPLGSLPLAWARAENVRGAEVYIRPARGRDWSLIFLDDLDPVIARSIARKYRALAVQTSLEGGCHVWLASTRPLSEDDRAVCQRWLAHRVGADPASTSGEHLGRLAGFKNWKRDGAWVNVLVATHVLPDWDPSPALQGNPPAPAPRSTHSRTRPGRDISESGREWGTVCTMLERGADPDAVHDWLLTRASPRRGMDAARYAQRTIDRATRHVRRSP